MRPILTRGALAALCILSSLVEIEAHEKPASKGRGAIPAPRTVARPHTPPKPHWPAGMGFHSGRIESVSPSSARPGDVVTLKGRGLGGRNATVTVGHRRARVLEASGSTIVFVVPAGTNAGPTVVAVRTPGGHGGRIQLTVLGSGPRVVRQDDARRSTAVVSSDGGVVQATSVGGARFSLDVPPGALAEDTVITLTPVTSLAGLPLSGAASFAVRMQPAGLQFDRPATLTITLPAGTDTPHLFGFVFDDDGGNFEVVRTGAGDTSLTLPIAHFTTAGVAEGSLEDFAREVEPRLNALPGTLPPTQVTPLLNQLNEWLRRFGLDVCTQTTLCIRVFDTAVRSLTLNRDQACGRGMSQLAIGEPFLARSAISSIVTLTSSIAVTSAEASSLGLAGFDTALSLDCVAGVITDAIDVARQQALENPRAGLLLLLLDLTADAAVLGLDEVETHGRNALAEVLETLLDRGRTLCETDSDAGEILLDVVRNTFPGIVLDGISAGLATGYFEAWAGCRIHITPVAHTIVRGGQVQFVANATGLAQGFTWSLRQPTGGGAIDGASGLYTAGRLDGTFVVVATSTSDGVRFKRATVTVVQITVAVTPAVVSVAAGERVRFVAAVGNAPDTRVRWTTTGGSIDETGSFTAGAQAGTFLVRATSLADELEFAESTVVVRPDENTLSGRLTYEFELMALNTGSVSQRAWLTADVTYRDGAVTATGTFEFLMIFESDCTAQVRTEAVITSAEILEGFPEGSFRLGFRREGTDTTSTCSSTSAPVPIVLLPSSMHMIGSVRREGERVVEIDFNFTETYDMPGFSGFYTQTGSLTRQ